MLMCLPECLLLKLLRLLRLLLRRLLLLHYLLCGCCTICCCFICCCFICCCFICCSSVRCGRSCSLPAGDTAPGTSGRELLCGRRVTGGMMRDGMGTGWGGVG